MNKRVAKKKRVVIVDSDILVYRVAAACEKRTIEVTHKKSKRKKIFNNRTEFKALLKAKNFAYVESDYKIKDIQTVNEDIPWRQVFERQVASFKEVLWGEELIFLISGNNNFRDLLPLPKAYKGNRKDALKPLLRQECKEYLKGKYKAVVVSGEEVDDQVIWLGYEYLAKGYEVIIVTSDKDSNAYSGLSLYDYTKEKPEIVQIPRLGSLWIDDKGKVRGLGFLFYALQAVTGDITDNFKPSELNGEKFGEKTAYDLLKACESEQEALQVVISKYMTWYPKRFTYKDWTGKTHSVIWKDIIDLYHKCARMKETRDDKLNFTDFAKQYGVDLDNYVDEVTE